jgi:AraC-like DNA-binding protein
MATLLSPPHYDTASRADGRIIPMESLWREAPAEAMSTDRSDRIVLSRWASPEIGVTEVSKDDADGYHVIAIAMQKADVNFWASGRQCIYGAVSSGTILLTGPSQPCRAIFHGPYDVLHLLIPQSVFAEGLESAHGKPSSDIAFCETLLFRDSNIERLAHALLAADSMAGTIGHIYADCISLALVRWLLTQHVGHRNASGRDVPPLPKWRLSRVLEYIEQRFCDAVTLRDLAAVSGLTRMHFAAQFRVATGQRPHEYVLRRRISHAQELLRDPNFHIAEVAYNTGFQSQAHFATVFKKVVGETPSNWRRLQVPSGSRF